MMNINNKCYICKEENALIINSKHVLESWCIICQRLISVNGKCNCYDNCKDLERYINISVDNLLSIGITSKEMINDVYSAFLYSSCERIEKVKRVNKEIEYKSYNIKDISGCEMTEFLDKVIFNEEEFYINIFLKYPIKNIIKSYMNLYLYIIDKFTLQINYSSPINMIKAIVLLNGLIDTYTDNQAVIIGKVGLGLCLKEFE